MSSGIHGNLEFGHHPQIELETRSLYFWFLRGIVYRRRGGWVVVDPDETRWENAVCERLCLVASSASTTPLQDCAGRL